MEGLFPFNELLEKNDNLWMFIYQYLFTSDLKNIWVFNGDKTAPFSLSVFWPAFSAKGFYKAHDGLKGTLMQIWKSCNTFVFI